MMKSFACLLRVGACIWISGHRHQNGNNSEAKKDDLDYQKQNHTKRLLARSLNKVKLVRSRRSSTGLAARLGPGSNWQRVLSIIPWDKWVLLIICNSPEWLLHIIKSVLFLSFRNFVNQGLLGRRPVPVCYAKWWILCFFAWHISRAPDTELTSRNVHQLLCTTGMVYRWQKMPRCRSIWVGKNNHTLVGKNNHTLISASGPRGKVIIIVSTRWPLLLPLAISVIHGQQFQNNISGEDYNYLWPGVGRHKESQGSIHSDSQALIWLSPRPRQGRRNSSPV